MSLREEIKELMVKANSWEEIEGQDSEYFTNEIISIFEKRIDSIQQRDETNEYLGYSGDEEFIDGFDIGWMEAFNRFKNEILKK